MSPLWVLMEVLVFLGGGVTFLPVVSHRRDFGPKRVNFSMGVLFGQNWLSQTPTSQTPSTSCTTLTTTTTPSPNPSFTSTKSFTTGQHHSDTSTTSLTTCSNQLTNHQLTKHQNNQPTQLLASAPTNQPIKQPTKQTSNQPTNQPGQELPALS